MVIIGKGGRVFWFLFGCLPKVCRAVWAISGRKGKTTPWFLWRKETMPIGPGPKGRFACVGDSIHKMTPNSGADGNAAIESAAALANAINSLKIAACNPCLEDVSHIMMGYQERKFRVSESINTAHQLTRLHALKGLKERLIAKYALPIGGDLLADLCADGWIGSTMLNYLPPPPRSLCGTMPFNPSQGVGKHESPLRRAIFALPLLAVGIWCFVVLMSLLPLVCSQKYLNPDV
ncbi:hypothetical protein GJ744_009153 [Endocarpon pusillum]|uniref:FAD-binding domain-containing protein n=1 Tax=Endocarpon pusillum TaxID=364733 RepID=A0A8H7AI83_9EURO|nr:hypothetical protein GJ744_009153 [Endocarpon pusillum]